MGVEAAGSAAFGSAISGGDAAFTPRQKTRAIAKKKRRDKDRLHAETANLLKQREKAVNRQLGTQRAQFGAAGVFFEGTPQAVADETLFEFNLENEFIIQSLAFDLKQISRESRQARDQHRRDSIQQGLSLGLGFAGGGGGGGA